MDRDVALRVWLEPGYDGGRCGAWMLDLPGCFAWRSDRAAALAAAPAAARDHVAWLLRHGEEVAHPTDGPVEVVEEVAVTIVDGYERKATFEADHRAVGSPELETMLRRLAFARTDLERLLPAIHASDAPDGSLGPDGRSERERQAVVRHVAGAEIWLAGRLDGTARYDGPGDDADLDAQLAATRAWAVATVRQLQARNPSVERTDGKGETWTLAKVLRRLLYHSLDHLGELERRTGATPAT